ncbi:MAG: NTP transferase domain-containing protein [Candidatus Eremiobacteraeota bacterium]|nr:NTP transferase domain-containing protein [Candidatus Eremiobacteraeota bacterium]
MNPPLTAVVLAGGPPDAVSALVPDAPNKAFVPIAGVTLVQRTLEALRSSSRIGRIIAVAPPVPSARAALSSADEIRDDGASMTQSLRSGLGGLPPAALVLVCASDLPILSRAALDEFIALAEANGADLTYACVEKSAHLARFADVPHTWARLAEGTFCGGGCVALRPRALARLELILGRLGRARKNPLRLAAIFGPQILASYAVGRLSIAAAERRASALLGADVRAAVCAPEIAINVDRASDVALAERLVRTRDAEARA